ncbi:MAG: hypothetical protein ACUZ9M_00295 [Candidatus Scalindua sp.]
MLKHIALQVQGNVVNVSGGGDADKEGGFYHNYFAQAESYSITNFGDACDERSIVLDIETTLLPLELKEKFDVVFTHTVLEHIYHIDQAIDNLCSMSRDMVITIVPFIQSFHHGAWYSDYWRFTPAVLTRLFNDRGFKTVFLEWNNDPLGNIYIAHVATKYPECHAHLVRENKDMEHGPGFARTQMMSGDSQEARMSSRVNMKRPKGYYELIVK